MSARPLAALAAFFAVLVLAGAPARAEDLAESGRTHFIDTCANCHGLITEDTASLTWENLRVPAVMNPVGPNLTHVYGRPAGKAEGYSYSKAFRAAAAGLVWSEDNLDRWITNTQAMIKGSSMFLKVDDADVRAAIIDYLERYARYPGYDCLC